MRSDGRRRAICFVGETVFQLASAVWLGLLVVWALGANPAAAQGQGQNVRLVGQIGGRCWSVCVQGNYAYIGEGHKLRILDVSNPASPAPLGMIPFPALVRSVYGTGALAYVANTGSGLQIIDISDPNGPALRGFYDTPGSAIGVYVSGGLAYVADYGSGLQIIDVSNPSAPTLRGS